MGSQALPDTMTSKLLLLGGAITIQKWWFTIFYYGLLWFTGWWFYITILKNMRSSSMGRINYPIYEMENNRVMFQTTNQAIAILKISQHPTT